MRYTLISNDGTPDNCTLLDENDNPVTGKYELLMRPNSAGVMEMVTNFTIFGSLEIITLPTKVECIEISQDRMTIVTQDDS